MIQLPPNALPNQERRKPQGLPVRSNLRAGVVLQVDIPSVVTIQQEAQTPAVVAPTTTS